MWKRPFDKDFVLFNLHHVHGFKFPVDKENPGFYVWKPNGMSRGITSLGLEREKGDVEHCVGLWGSWSSENDLAFLMKKPLKHSSKGVGCVWEGSGWET